MDLRDSPEDAAFRAEARHWLETNLTGEFAEARGLGRAGLQHEGRGLRTAWERKLGEDGWTCVGWPVEYGGRGAPMSQQVIWNEEYVRADAPARVNVMGEGLLGPTLIAYGTQAQKDRFLNPIRWGVELWCQGYSEPNAGSDLANVQTKAVLEHGEWVITGQKVWTSYAQWSDWCFVALSHRPRSGAPPGPVVPSRPHGPTRRRGPAHPADDGDLGVQRGLLRPGPHRRRPRGGRGERRLARRSRHPGVRARRRPAR